MMVFRIKERPRHFFSDPRPRRGRQAPLDPVARDPGEPATLPTLTGLQRAEMRLTRDRLGMGLRRLSG